MDMRLRRVFLFEGNANPQLFSFPFYHQKVIL
jgi:hypothetical protein